MKLLLCLFFFSFVWDIYLTIFLNIIIYILVYSGYHIIFRKNKYTLEYRHLGSNCCNVLFTKKYYVQRWDNCGIGNSQKLEQLQLEAARIVTGLPIFTKTEIVYRETGWELLSARRKRRKLQLFYSIVNKNTLNYLCTLIPPTIQRTSVYPLRNGNDIILPFCRLVIPLSPPQ